jgi:transcriptional regulator GlxA family with amidase domain
MVDKKYKTLVLSVKRNVKDPYVETIQGDIKHRLRENGQQVENTENHPPCSSSCSSSMTRNITRTVTLEQVTRTIKLEPARGRLRLGILIYTDVNVLDYCIPSEVFTTTRLPQPSSPFAKESPYQVLLIAKQLSPVITSSGMEVMPHVDFESCPPLDLLLVPGGAGVKTCRYSTSVINFLRQQGEQCNVLASVSSGAILLAQAGLLDGRHVTTHTDQLQLLATEFGDTLHVQRNLHWVQHGKVFSCAGSAAGLDMALNIISRIHGEHVAMATARHMDYPFPDTNKRRYDVDENEDDGLDNSNCELKCTIM